MFRVYKPKNVVRVKAVQITPENIADLAQLLMGRVDVTPGQETTLLAVPTFDGVKTFLLGQWILRGDDNVLTSMDNEQFQKAYEVARNTAGS